MSRFVAVLDRTPRADLEQRLANAERAMVAGGSREVIRRYVRPPFGLVAFAHDEREPAWQEDGAALVFHAGHTPAAPAVDFLASCATALRASGSVALPPRPVEASRRQVLGRWDPEHEELVLVTEPNGQLPVHVRHDRDATLIATEPKGIWALGGAAEVDADALVELWTLGHCLAPHTLLKGIERAEPGVAYRFGREGRAQCAWNAPMFSDDRRGDSERLAQRANAALLEVLGDHRQKIDRVSVALSGGMDSRYVLAGARRTWAEVDSFTFGGADASDARVGMAIAARAGVPNQLYSPAAEFVRRWGPYAAWRADGLLNCVHAHGMDATIAHGARMRHALNGIGGDFLMGAFLRPSHLFEPADPERAIRFILASRRFHTRPLSAILKPELLERAGDSVEARLRAVLERYRYRRLGNLLLSYWLRHYSPMISAIGLALEDPWVEWIGPLIDPRFVAAIADIPLEQRFMGRLYRRALARLAPELTTTAWDRTGVAPRWPWPAHALGRYGRRFGLLPRSRPAVDHARDLRTSEPWLREMLLSPRTSADGYVQPAYLRELVEAHVSGREDRMSEIGMALTIELWRRMFIDREGFEAPAMLHF